MCDFLHRLLRSMAPRNCLPVECDWDAMRCLDFAVGKFLSFPDFMQTTKFHNEALKVARSKTDVERERGKNVNANAIWSRQTIYVAQKMLRHPNFKSDLIIGLTCFDYDVLLKLPRAETVDPYQQFFQIFSARGVTIEDKVSLFSTCPEPAWSEFTWHALRLNFLCLSHMFNLPDYLLVSGRVGTASLDLPCFIEPVQGYLLISDSDGNFLLDFFSVSSCLELLETFTIERCSLITVFGNL